jgi:peptidoglycan/LPS O-acetylase OafA/YrhL
VIAHGIDAFYWPNDAFDRPFYILTLPIFRLSLQGGFLAVAIFFLISGYVVAMKPLKLARGAKPEEARKAIASGAFRRLLRLGAPVTVATLISWSLDRMGAFNLARSFPDWNWLVRFSPPVVEGFLPGLRLLTSALVSPFISQLMVASNVGV